MKFTLKKTSDCEFSKPINIETIEELIKLTKKFGHALIVGRDYGGGLDTWSVEIYDGYRE